MRVGEFCVRVHTLDGTLLPEVEHHGKTYLVSIPGAEFTISVIKDNEGGAQLENDMHRRLSKAPIYKAKLLVDGKDVGYRKLLSSGETSAFDGFLTSADPQGHSVYKSFKFQSISEGTGRGSKLVDPQVGTLRITVFNCEKTTRRCQGPQGCKVPSAHVAPMPEGKKWFMAPSLVTTGGQSHARKCGWSTFHFDSTAKAAEFTLHYETAMTLYLRKVLDPVRDKATLKKCQQWDPTLRTLLQAKGASDTKTVIASSGRPGGQHVGDWVKEEGSRKRPRADRAGPSTTYEMINLVKQEVTPLRVNGKEVQRNEVAVCDLVRDTAQWSVRKKPTLRVMESRL